MGKSAKVHKRVKKSSLSGPTVTPSSSRIEAAQSAKKRSKLKNKVTSITQTPAVAPTPADSGPGKRPSVLGGADYVSLLIGGRKKAKEEALKLPQNST